MTNLVLHQDLLFQTALIPHSRQLISGTETSDVLEEPSPELSSRENLIDWPMNIIERLAAKRGTEFSPQS